MKIKLPKFIRYIKCKERLVRYTVNIDLLTRERILNSHFSMLTEKFSQIHSVSMGKWIRFSVPVAFYKKSKKFREFETNATALCKSLGYILMAGYSSGWRLVNEIECVIVSKSIKRHDDYCEVIQLED